MDAVDDADDDDAGSADDHGDADDGDYVVVDNGDSGADDYENDDDDVAVNVVKYVADKDGLGAHLSFCSNTAGYAQPWLTQSW